VEYGNPSLADQDAGSAGESMFSSDSVRSIGLIAVAVVVLGTMVFLYKSARCSLRDHF
jgi:hypothetical protein